MDTQKKYHAPSNCPVCGDVMEIVKLKCKKCGCELSGSFTPCKFCMLEEKHMQFVEAFLRCRGSIKEMEKMLGVSYPTVKNMMDAALLALGFDEKKSERQKRVESEKEEILAKLAAKEMDVDTAIKRLNALKGGNGNEQ